jgi:hypothetical protein
MPRIRTIKPDLWADERVGAMQREERLLWIGLITQADDEGRLHYRPRIIRQAIFPYDDDISDDMVQRWLDNLTNEQLICVYSVNGNYYIQIKNWSKHQNVNRPSPSKIPPSPEDSVRTHGVFSEDSVSEKEEEEEEEVVVPRQGGLTEDSLNTLEVSGELQRIIDHYSEAFNRLTPNSDEVSMLRQTLEELEKEIHRHGLGDDLESPEEIIHLEINTLANKPPNKRNANYLFGMVMGKLKDHLEGA